MKKIKKVLSKLKPTTETFIILLFAIVIYYIFTFVNIFRQLDEMQEKLDKANEKITKLEHNLEETNRAVEDNYWFFYDQGVSEYKGEYEYYE